MKTVTLLSLFAALSMNAFATSTTASTSTSTTAPTPAPAHTGPNTIKHEQHVQAAQQKCTAAGGTWIPGTPAENGQKAKPGHCQKPTSSTPSTPTP